MDRKIGIIYKKYQFKLKLNKDTIEYAQRLHEDIVEKSPFMHESPYLITAICIFIVTRIDEQPKTFKEISDVSHIRESELRHCYEMVFEEIEASLKKL